MTVFIIGLDTRDHITTGILSWRWSGVEQTELSAFIRELSGVEARVEGGVL